MKIVQEETVLVGDPLYISFEVAYGCPHYIQAEISPVDLTLTGFYAWDGYMQWCTKNKLDLYASWLAAGILYDAGP